MDEVPGLSTRLTGAFIRSTEQLRRFEQRKSLRIDDTGTCVVAVRAALQMVRGLPTAGESSAKGEGKEKKRKEKKEEESPTAEL